MRYNKKEKDTLPKRNMASKRFAMNSFHVPWTFMEIRTPNSLENAFKEISVMSKNAVFSTCC